MTFRGDGISPDYEDKYTPIQAGVDEDRSRVKRTGSVFDESSGSQFTRLRIDIWEWRFGAEALYQTWLEPGVDYVQEAAASAQVLTGVWLCVLPVRSNGA